MSETKCGLEECKNPISDILGVICECGLCEKHCIEICAGSFECNCDDDLLAIRIDSEFETEEEMQNYARYEGKVILTKHTKPIIDERDENNE